MGRAGCKMQNPILQESQVRVISVGDKIGFIGDDIYGSI